MKTITMYATIFENSGLSKRTYETGLIPDDKRQEMNVVNLYPEKEYQTIEGFGGALTEAAGYTLARLSEENYQKIIDAYYGADGIGYTLGRIHMDSSDFSIDPYCAVQKADDPEFHDFSLERDGKYVQPMIRRINDALGKNVTLLLSPWSPPAFMKETGVRNGGGHLRKDCYQTYADYIAKYLQEYKKMGMPVSYMTVQNEPLAVQTWDSCEYTSEEEKEFLKEYLYPTLQEKGLGDVEIYIWDHNKERVYERACEIVDAETEKMVAGVAYHWYSGDHFDALQMVREDFPNLKLMRSEGCTEFVASGTSTEREVEHARKYAHDMIGDLNHGMNTWFDWNIVLDEIGGPNHVDNFCSAPVMCDTIKDTVEMKPSFHAIAHFSKYIKPGAVRIGSSSFSQELEMTAAKNPDGSCVVVMMNTSKETKVINLRVNGFYTKLQIWGNSICTAVIR